MSNPSPEKLAEWKFRASQKNAIVPEYFEVFPDKVDLVCGICGQHYTRPLIIGRNEPIFVCPEDTCKARNWVPVRFNLK